MVCPLPINYSSPIDYQFYLVSYQGVPLPPPPHPPKKKPQKTKPQNKDPETKKEKENKKKERELSLRILPRRTRLLTSLHREKARKAWPTASILNEIFIFIEFYICAKYQISGDSVCNLHNEYSVLLYVLY